MGQHWLHRTPRCVLSRPQDVQSPASQHGLVAPVPGVVAVDVRVVVRLHLDLDLGHGAGHPTAHRHGRRRRAGDLQVEGDAEEGQAPVTIHTHGQETLRGGGEEAGEGGGAGPRGVMSPGHNTAAAQHEREESG